MQNKSFTFEVPTYLLHESYQIIYLESYLILVLENPKKNIGTLNWNPCPDHIPIFIGTQNILYF